MDPFLDLIHLLRPRAMLWSQVEARGDWAVSFPQKNDLLFCSVLHGECLLLRNPSPATRLVAGDFVLVRTDAAFVLASDAGLVPEDSEKVFQSAENLSVRLGDGPDRRVTLHGGRFVFDSANEDLLTALLPPMIHVTAEAQSAERVRQLLQMSSSEAACPKPGSEFVAARLVELLLVEILRDPSLGLGSATGSAHRGMLTGLADSVAAVALRAMHQDVAHNWTVAALARLAGVSRSKFAVRFEQATGVAPIRYLHQWRMAIAKDELRKGQRSLSEIAFAIGFQSVSAFSTAFRKTVGYAPGHYASTVR